MRLVARRDGGRQARRALLSRRDGRASEILDGDRVAFEKTRPSQSGIELDEAQMRIVKGIERATRRSGAHRSLVALILRAAQRRVRKGHGAPLTILDAAAGSGWLLRELWRGAKRRGLPVRLGLNDLNPRLVRAAEARLASEGISCVATVDDARHLSETATGEWDLAVLTYTLHHFGPLDAVECLKSLDRVSRGGMFVLDVDRSLLGLLAVPVVVSLFAPRSFPYAARDGLVSVRRAYTREELAALVRHAQLGHPYRVVPLPTLHPQRFLTNAVVPA